MGKGVACRSGEGVHPIRLPLRQGSVQGASRGGERASHNHQEVRFSSCTSSAPASDRQLQSLSTFPFPSIIFPPPPLSPHCQLYLSQLSNHCIVQKKYFIIRQCQCTSTINSIPFLSSPILRTFYRNTIRPIKFQKKKKNQTNTCRSLQSCSWIFG